MLGLIRNDIPSDAINIGYQIQGFLTVTSDQSICDQWIKDHDRAFNSSGWGANKCIESRVYPLECPMEVGLREYK